MTKLTELSKKYCSRIKSPLSIEQICEQIESSEYSAELMLQHLVLAAAELEKEVHEQCVLNGKGAEREADLLGKVERLEKDNAILKKKYNILFSISTTSARCAGHKALQPWGKALDKWCDRAETLGFKKEEQS